MKYRIGDFAIITRLSVKTLRYYHEEGLLEPSRIAFDTGYRYYDGELIDIARIIGTLRQWGFSIREIREILHDYSDDSDLIEIVKKKRAEISHPDVEYKVLPACKVVSTIHVGPYDELGRAYQRLIDYRNEHSPGSKDPCREIYIKGPGMIFRGNPSKYVTEVQMPVV